MQRYLRTYILRSWKLWDETNELQNGIHCSVESRSFFSECLTLLSYCIFGRLCTLSLQMCILLLVRLGSGNYEIREDLTHLSVVERVFAQHSVSKSNSFCYSNCACVLSYCTCVIFDVYSLASEICFDELTLFVSIFECSRWSLRD